MFDHDDETPTGGYWPSVTDLFMTLFIISIVILGAVFYVLMPKNNIVGEKEIIIAVGRDFAGILEPTNKLRVKLGLPIVNYQTAKKAIQDLKETCNVAVSRIGSYEEKIDQLQSEIESLKKLVADPKEIERLLEQIAKLEREIALLKEKVEGLEKKTPGKPDLAELQRKIKELERQLKENNVNVVIDEKREEFSFDSGSPVITPDFSKALRKNKNPEDKDEPPFPKIAAEIINRKGRVDTLEIIGHTDGVPLSTAGNLDQRLPELLAGQLAGAKHLSAGSNNDLGLLRALSLKYEWQAYVEAYEPPDQRAVLQRIGLRCYSAGQTILPVPVLHPNPQAFRRNDPSARRIEMRLTRLGKVEDDNEAKVHQEAH